MESFGISGNGGGPSRSTSSNTKATKTPEEVEQTKEKERLKALEKARKDAERRQQREQPLSKAAEYLRKLPKDISASAEAIKEAAGADQMNDLIREEYKKTFEQHEAKLKEWRALTLENIL